MTAQITIKSQNKLDLDDRVKALQYLSDKATTQELVNLHKLAKDPSMREMLKNL
jgi:hypothetical protein